MCGTGTEIGTPPRKMHARWRTFTLSSLGKSGSQMPNMMTEKTRPARCNRRMTLAQIFHAGSGHPGGCLSCAELMTYLWQCELSANDDAPERHRFVLSKGHACPALYAAAAGAGILERRMLRTFRKLGSALQGHPHVLDTPWVETSTGSLGQGFSFALGCALGAKRKNLSFRTYALLGDGELNEGQIWEGMMIGAHYNLDNIVAIVDYNKYQSDDLNTNITALEPLMDKFKAFGWYAMEIDGHDFREIGNALDRARKIKGKPSIILAHTIKGKGISFMENNPKWHGSMAPQGEERECALKECGCEELEL